MGKTGIRGIAIALALSGALTEGSPWRHWRGVDGNGNAAGGAPLQWGDGQNVKWKVKIPGRGNSSPIVVGDRIFLTTAIPTGAPPPPPSPPQDGQRGPGGGAGSLTEHKFVVMALDRETGRPVWERTAIASTPHEGYHRQYGSFASASPVSDGERLYVFFGSRGLYCYDLDGELLWKKDLGNFQMRLGFGEGVAPAVYGDAIVVNMDHEGDSFIVAMNKHNGEELWRKARDERSNWSEPRVVEHGGRTQVIVSAENRVRSYDLKTGELIWECGGLGGNVIPYPVVEEDIVVVMSGWRDANMMAIRLGGEGDITGSGRVVWTEERGAAYTPSPVLSDGKLYVLSDRGLISCFDVATGKPYYHQQRLPGPYNFKASLVAADGRLYLASENEDVLVLKLGAEFEVLATNKLRDAMFVATPAIAHGDLFLRSQDHLYRIGQD
ncbi:MAG: PQQ-binding-like beta-propeller repeat protein [Bryobacteraceae bacterium]|nr:PQQ-binding-like beta-propeller repeat protein [Bryobacteraceae bacterium]